jgi:hypothetical protein
MFRRRLLPPLSGRPDNCGSTSETPVSFYQITRRNIPEVGHSILAAVTTWHHNVSFAFIIHGVVFRLWRIWRSQKSTSAHHSITRPYERGKLNFAWPTTGYEGWRALLNSLTSRFNPCNAGKVLIDYRLLKGSLVCQFVQKIASSVINNLMGLVHRSNCIINQIFIYGLSCLTTLRSSDCAPSNGRMINKQSIERI